MDTAREPERLEKFYTLINTFSKKVKRQKNVSMASTDYKKAYDIVPQRWIIDCFKMYKIPDDIIKFIEETMKNCRVEITAGGKRLAEVKIRRCIFFQEDALLSLLFL